jgi:hypothetical protein
MGEVFRWLTGAPTSYLDFKTMSDAEKAASWSYLTTQLTLGQVLSAGTLATTTTRTSAGIVKNHGYTVLGAYTVTDKAGDSVKIVNMRSPWHESSYAGPYNSGSSEFTGDSSL